VQRQRDSIKEDEHCTFHPKISNLPPRLSADYSKLNTKAIE